jgi:hypothetical protein
MRSSTNIISSYEVSQGGMIAPDFFRTQPSGLSLLQQEQARQTAQARQQEQMQYYQNRLPLYMQQGQSQEQLFNPSLVSLLGSVHHLHQQIPTLHGAPLRMNPSQYTDRASPPATDRSSLYHLPMGSIRGSQSAVMPAQYFQPMAQTPSFLDLMPLRENRLSASRLSALDLSELPFLGTGRASSFLQSSLNLTSLHPSHQYRSSEASTAFNLGEEEFPFFLDGNARATLHSGDSIPWDLPVLLARPEDSEKLSLHQVLLRHQIEAFKATNDDVLTHTRGRNKPICLGQVGIRCRHCKHLPVAKRQKGAVYFPASLSGLYQASQNMSTTHLQCGLCSEMPLVIKHQFAMLMSTKASSSGAGRPYWADSATKLGLVDTDEGIRFVRDVKPTPVKSKKAKQANSEETKDDYDST